MYFFLVNFSVAEIFSTSTEVPKLLTNVLWGKTTVCFACCMAQGFLLFAVGCVEFIILTVMSFDRYVAICKPLRYKTILTNEVCLHLASLAWIGGFAIIFSQSVVVWTYPYCGDNVVDHFFCDVGPVLKLACTDTSLMELVGLIYAATFMQHDLRNMCKCKQGKQCGKREKREKGKEMGNGTLVTEFILLGFSEIHDLKTIFFTTLLSMYLLSVIGHSLIIVVVFSEPKLHTPMYFFLVNFSVAEICSTTAEMPKMFFNMATGKRTICFVCCMAQGFLVFTMGCVEFIILMVMSFDRYVAICKLLRYKTILTNEVCLHLSLRTWLGGFVIIFSQSVVVWTYPYCGDNVIDHFFCDVGPVLKLACAETSLMELIRHEIQFGSFVPIITQQAFWI
ncbi:hypothetical protein lerEdw1_011590 [Lerista edwardsae]|nr:hypothetical protein lerEdw1_011590 [Lerista edwardsae]